MGGPFREGTIYWEVHYPMEARPVNVILFSFHALLKNKEHLIIFEKLISINECNFRFINVEVARIITSMIKSSMKVQLFQWSQVFKNPEWKPMLMHGSKSSRLIYTLFFLSC
jgi:hypothetical protein